VGSPLINEEMLVGVLDTPADPDTTQQLQSGSVLSILDGFDRQLQRTEFIRVLTEAMALHGLVGRLETLSTVVAIIESDKVDLKRLKEAVAGQRASAEQHRKALKKQMELVAQCPWDHDAKH